MNLAEFPISVASKKQPREADGRKLDQISYESSTYDLNTRRRVPQRVTLTTSSRYGLPTPADENVILALLCVAKKANDFTDPRVYFVPRQLFRIMGWALNSRSYDRLTTVLLRLQMVQLLYENAWWNAQGEEYEEKFATGIIADFRLRKPKAVKKDEEPSLSYVHWRPEFFKSLSNENIKKLDLELYFALKLAPTQRMYRFLDKRFYTSPAVELDLTEFACGHIGLTDPGNVALLKRRLAPAIAELERIGFITPAAAKERYRKVKKGIWRVRFEPGAKRPLPNRQGDGQPSLPSPAPDPSSPEARLVTNFYELWSPGTPPSEQAHNQARELIVKHGAELVESWLPRVVKRMKQDWPDAKHFGATSRFFADIAEEHKVRQQNEQQLEAEKRQKRQEREADEQRAAEDQAFADKWQPVWDALSESEREAIRSTALAEYPAYNQRGRRTSYIATRICLQELARQRSEPPAIDVADGRQTV